MDFFNSSLILKNDGTLWGCGLNNNGQLGLGDTTNRTTFTQITTNADNVKSVHCGCHHTFILKNDGTLWSTGYNAEGELCLEGGNRYTFTQVTTNTDNIKEIHCGGYHNIVLKNDGTLWACGYNRHFGQLGLGDTIDRITLTQVAANTDNIKSVYCGYYHNIILKNDGTLWGCGKNDYGQLGLGDTANRTTFTQITTNADNVKSVYCGYNHTFILENDGTLWGCGNNQYGQLGLGDITNRTTFTQVTANTDDIKEIYCSAAHTFILKNDGTLLGCGNNQYGQLGLGDTTNRTTFTQITTNANNIKEIYCGTYHTLILENDGTLWGCGRNDYGQLGLGDSTNRNIFTEITTNADDIKSFPNQYDIPTIIKVYDLNTGLIETLDTNNFKNIPVDKFEKIKVLYTNPAGTYINCLVSFDQKQTWKTFTGSIWNVVSDTTPSNIQSVGMDISKINELNKDKLIAGGFTGDIDFKITLKTNDDTKTPSITKIYIEYKK